MKPREEPKMPQKSRCNQRSRIMQLLVGLVHGPFALDARSLPMPDDADAAEEDKR